MHLDRLGVRFVSLAVLLLGGCQTDHINACDDAGACPAEEARADGEGAPPDAAPFDSDAEVDGADGGGPDPATTDPDAGGGSDGGDAGGPPACALRVVEGPNYTLSVEASGHLASLELSPKDYADVATSCDPIMTGWAGIVASHFADEFDFQIFIMNQPGSPPDAVCNGKHLGVRSDIQGIGRATYDRGGFDAQPRLESVIFLGREHDISMGNVMHEITHRWGNSLQSIDTGSHWGASDVNGNLGGGFEGFRALGDGTYAARGAAPRGIGASGDLELYLMGLIPASEVPPVHWLRNWEPAGDGEEDEAIFSADELVTVTIDDIIAVDGPRIPDHLSAQRDFRALTVIVTQGALSAAKWSQQRRAVEGFESLETPVVSTGTGTYFVPGSLPGGRCACGRVHNFKAATRGLATMDMSGVLDALLEPDAHCLPELPETGRACAGIRSRAAACGIPQSTCEVDTTYTPAVAECIGACAAAAPCDELIAADRNPAGSSLDNSFTDCVYECTHKG